VATEQQFLVTVNVDTIGDLGVFDKRTGGDNTVASVKHRPGGMGPEKSYSSLPTYSVVSVTRVYERVRDHELVRLLRTLSGSARATVIEQPLDSDGNAYGVPTTWRGRLSNVKSGGADSTSVTLRMFEIDVEPETVS
jgi:hypothetical protein